jgi:hypothetical protein
LGLLNFPRQHAPTAEQEGQRDRATNPQHLGRPHVDGAEAAAGLSVPSCLGADEPRAGERPLLQMIERDAARRVAARAGDVRLEAERRDFAECREGQRVEHAPKVGIGTPLTPSALAERLPGNDDSKACVGRKQLDVALWSRLGPGRHSDLPEAAHM